MSSASKVWIGCDVGGTQVKLARLHGTQVVACERHDTPSHPDGSRVLKELARAIRVFLSAANPPPEAVGVALPGFLAPQRDKVVRLSNLPALDGLNVRTALRRRLRHRVILDTDTNAGALAEAVIGAGRGKARILYLSLGTGVGAAMVVDGHPVRVSHHSIGHVAHLPLWDPSASRKGKPATAEELLSARGVLRRARRAGLHRLSDTEALWRLAQEGQSGQERRSARRVWREVGELVGRLGGTLASLWGPETVVVGGGLSRASEAFLPRARTTLTREWPVALGRVPTLRAAAAGRDSGAVGAALLAACSLHGED